MRQVPEITATARLSRWVCGRTWVWGAMFSKSAFHDAAVDAKRGSGDRG
jgi:hypothetical protein